MFADHELLCRARNELADALKALLRPDIMDAIDFRQSLDHATAATDALIELLQQPNRDAAQS